MKIKSFVALIGVLIVGAIASAVAVSLLVLGVGATQNSQTLMNSHLSRSLSDACAEEALEKIKDSDFIGTSSLDLTGGKTCQYIVSNTGGTSREIRASSTFDNNTRKVKVTCTRDTNTNITINSWQEIADF